MPRQLAVVVGGIRKLVSTTASISALSSFNKTSLTNVPFALSVKFPEILFYNYGLCIHVLYLNNLYSGYIMCALFFIIIQPLLEI